MDRDLGISKAGNPRGRTVVIELACLWLLRYQAQSKLTRWFEERTNGLKGRLRPHRQRGRGAQARDRMWHYHEAGLIPDSAELKT